MRRRIASLLLCGAMLLSLYPLTAAAEAVRDSGLSAQTVGSCEQHPQHTDECYPLESVSGDTATPSDAEEAVTVERVQGQALKLRMPRTMFFASNAGRPAYSGGDGTKENPWLISSVEDLRTLAETINSGKASEIDADADTGGEGVAGNYYGYYFRQTCALDLSGIESWDPIGYSGSCYFAGNYDGGGYSISGMKSTGKTDAEGYASAGLFGWVAFGSVSNVHITDADLKATGVGNYSYAGGIAGVVYGSDITNCSVSGSTIESARDSNNNCAGGIAGYSTGGTFSKCAAEDNAVKTMAYGGGFVGEIDDDCGAGESSFTDCYVAKSTVTSFTEEAGGLSFAGEFAGEATVSALNLTNCFVYENTAQIGAGSEPTIKRTGVFAGNLWQNATVAPLNLRNCYYYTTAETADNTGNANAKTREEFANGTVNSSLGDAFIQGTEYPVLAFVYPVKLETDGGVIADGKAVESYTRGVGATLPTADDITRESYTFEGWYESSDFSGEAVTAISATDTGDKTYYAKWTKPYTVTVATEGGGTVSGGGTFEDGSTVTVTATANSGYHFVCWTENGTEVSTSASYTFILAADRSLIAVFGRNSSGGGTAPTYPPAVDAAGGGSVEISPARPLRGQTVTLRPVPDEGREVRGVAVTDGDGDPVEVIDNGDGTWSFVQPKGAVTIEVTFGCDGSGLCPGRRFPDVDVDAWYHDAVDWALENGVMTGYADGTLGPDGALSRAQLATVLWRLAGEPEAKSEASFADCDPGAFYAEAVAWADEAGIVCGYGDGASFGPEDPVTREQLSTILWRAAGEPEGTGDLSAFPDGGEATDYAVPALEWAVGEGVLSGFGDGSLAPTGALSRAQMAAVLYRRALAAAE